MTSMEYLCILTERPGKCMLEKTDWNGKWIRRMKYHRNDKNNFAVRNQGIPLVSGRAVVPVSPALYMERISFVMNGIYSKDGRKVAFDYIGKKHR